MKLNDRRIHDIWLLKWPAYITVIVLCDNRNGHDRASIRQQTKIQQTSQGSTDPVQTI